jgi:hypothetical protein
MRAMNEAGIFLGGTNALSSADGAGPSNEGKSKPCACPEKRTVILDEPRQYY